MGKINRHIEIVSSSISSLSSMSKASRSAIQKTLSKYYKRVDITLVDNLSDLDALIAKAPDLVFLGMKFISKNSQLNLNDTQNIWLADYLTERGIATTGSQSTAHHLEINKPLAKQCVARAGLDTSAYYIVKTDEHLEPNTTLSEYPLFVKPANRGGGLGIDSDSIVNNFLELKNKVNSISKNFNSDSLIEKYLPGREFSVAVLKNKDRLGYTGMPLELIAPKNEKGERLLSGKVKSADAEQVKEVTDTQIRKSIMELAINAFQAIGGRDYGRIDIRMDEHGTPHFLEANLIPSLIDNYGSFPKACALNQNISYEEMLLQITALGMTRSIILNEIPQPAFSPDIAFN